MNTKRFAALLLSLCLILGLCACTGSTDNNETTAASTAATTQPAETTEATEAATPSHTVKVVDEGGNPIAGVFVQICLDTCTPAQTDANGVASYYDMPEADYEIKLMAMPSGYGYTTEEEIFFFPDGSTEATITLQAIA